MTKHVTLSQARHTRRPLYYQRRRDGALLPVLCWRKWGADIHLVTLAGTFVVSHKTILEVETR